MITHWGQMMKKGYIRNIDYGMKEYFSLFKGIVERNLQTLYKACEGI